MSLISKEHLQLTLQTIKKLLDTKVNKKDIQNYITLTDSANGFKYKVGMRNGNLISASNIVSIEIVAPPNKTEYYIGEVFDPTGMVVSAVREDGTVDIIEGYTIDFGAIDISGNTIDISYTEFGTNYKFSNFNIDSYITIIFDFDYIAESDGTYTLTGWKQTLNGTSSTECIIPDNPKINL